MAGQVNLISLIYIASIAIPVWGIVKSSMIALYYVCPTRSTEIPYYSPHQTYHLAAVFQTQSQAY